MNLNCYTPIRRAVFQELAELFYEFKQSSDVHMPLWLKTHTIEPFIRSTVQEYRL